MLTQCPNATWFGEIASIVCLADKAAKMGNLIEFHRPQNGFSVSFPH